MDESRLVARAVSGDREAFGSLVGLHQARVRGTISRFIAGSEEVFDVAQNTFIEAYRSLARFDRSLDFGRWLNGIAVNLIRQHLRRESRHRSRELRAFEETLRRWRAERLEREGNEDRLGPLRECVEQLDAESRALVQLRYFDGLELGAVAARVRKSAGSLAMQFLRIRSLLARCVRGKLEVAR